MRNGLAVVLASLALVAGCPGGGGGGGGGATPCDALGKCPQGLLCDPVSDTCVTPEAFDWCTLVTCPNGEVCDLTQDSGCRPATSCAEVTCDAGAGLHCDWLDFTCTRTPRCTYADECPSGHFCDTHRLCVEPGPGECLDTGDCQAGYTCDLATHLCRGAVACASQGACSPGWTCVTAGRCELLAPGTCDAANDCGAGAACQAGLCVGCGTEGTICAGNFEGCDTGANQCLACAPGSCTQPGDACAAPHPLALAEGRNVISVDLRGYACDGADCAAGLADVWWTFTLASNARVELGVAAEAYGAAAPRLELREAACGARLAGHVFASGTERRAMELPAGTYALRLVGPSAAATPLTLFVSVTSQVASVASCGNPLVFVPDYWTGELLLSFSSGARNHVSGDSCSGAWGGGAVMALDLAVRSYVEVKVDTGNLNTTALGAEFKEACLPQAPYACYAAPGVDVVATARRVGPGRQYVVVHGDAPDLHGASVRAVTRPWPANDLCATAAAMPAPTWDGSGYSSSIKGSTADDQSLPDAPLGCGGTTYGGNDAFFTFATTAERSLTITVTPDAPGTWTPVVAIEGTCGVVAGVGCSVGGPGTAATFSLDALEVGQHVVHVMSASGPGGPFTVKLTLNPPIYPARPNGSCWAPSAPEQIVLAAVGDSVTTAGDTRGGVETGYAACAPGTGSEDLVYEVALPTSAPRGRVRLTATPLRTTYDPVLAAQSTCGDYTADLGCWSSSGSGVAETAAVSVNGSAFVWVRGAGGTAGPFQLTATYEAAAPANDTCADAATSTLSMPTVTTPASITGDLSAATATAGTCGGGLVDAFHVVTVASGGGPAAPVNLTLTPSGFTGRLRIFLSDCSNCYLATATGTGPGAPVVLQIASMRTGDVRTIGVSSADGKVGTYTLQAGP